MSEDDQLQRHSRPLTGMRLRLMRLVGRGLSAGHSLLGRLPPGRWLHRHLHGGREVTSTDLPLREGGPGLDRLEVAFLSDLHAGLFMSAADVSAVAEGVAALAPELVCLGGDLVNAHLDEIGHLERLIEVLDPPLGMYAVPGNHEHVYIDELADWTRFLEERGVHVLLNRGRRVERGGESLWIAGIDDLTRGAPDLDAALAGRRDGEPVLLLSHHPDAFLATSERIDVQLSGHTHGGQISLFGWTPVTHSQHGFVRGVHRRNGAHLYVGRGVGVTAFPLRIGTRGEVAILRLRASGM